MLRRGAPLDLGTHDELMARCDLYRRIFARYGKRTQPLAPKGTSHMGFVFDGLEPRRIDRSYSDRQLAARIVSYFRPELGQMLLVALMIVLASLANTAFPIFIAQGVGAAQGGIPAQTVVLIVAALLLSGALAWGFNFVRQWYTARAVGDVVLRLRQDAFDAVLARDLSFYDEFPSGKIVSRVTSDTKDFTTVVTLVLNLISQVLLVVLLAAVLFVVDARLALLALSITPVLVVVALGFRRIARKTTRHAQRVRGNVNALIQETIAGISIAKNFRQERMIYDQFTGVNRQSYQVTLRQGLFFTAIFPILYLIAGLGTVIVIYFGGRGVLAGSINAGRVVSLRAGGRPLLVPHHQHRQLLEPVPAGIIRQRARLRPDRRRAARPAERARAGKQSRRAHRVPPARLRLH